MKRAENADVTALIASSGGGKSHWVRGVKLPTLKRPVLIWDTMAEYGDVGRSRESLSAVVEDLRAGREVIPFVPKRGDFKAMAAQFHTFCGIVLARGECSMIAEELMYVTKAGWAPPRWIEIITNGRHHSLSVVGTTQRPQLCDKTFISGATLVRVGFLRGNSDKKVMADTLDLDVAELRALKKRQWIQVDDSAQVTRELDAPAPGKARRSRTRR